MEELLIKAALGPGGALAVLLLVLGAIYRLSVNHGFPILKQYVSDQQENIKDILKEHREDRKVFKEAVTSLTTRYDRLEGDVHEIKTDLHDIKNKIK
jgi:hypothetical protein